MITPSHDFESSGFCEAVVIVNDVQPHLRTWVETGGWTIRHQGAVDASVLSAWEIPTASAQEWLLGHPDCAGGTVRLVCFDDLAGQSLIREDDQCWDTGGIFDLNIRVLNVARKAAALRSQGWHGAAPPVQWDFGVLTVKEWLVKGPDNVRLAIIERVAPPLEGFTHLRKFSQVFNSSQIVTDMAAAKSFYCDVLGFAMSYRFQIDTIPPGPNVFGLPENVAKNVGLELNIVHPKGAMEGSVELVKFTGAQGLDMSADARPPNLGIAALRFPTKGLAALAQRLRQHSWPIEFSRQEILLPPFGRVAMLAVRAPDGAWLEFFEPT